MHVVAPAVSIPQDFLSLHGCLLSMGCVPQMSTSFRELAFWVRFEWVRGTCVYASSKPGPGPMFALCFWDMLTCTQPARFRGIQSPHICGNSEDGATEQKEAQDAQGWQLSFSSSVLQ